MRLFICEFITGGGLQDKELPVNLAREGDMMLNALLSDFLELGVSDIFTTRDNRLHAISLPVEIVAIDGDVYNVWQSCMNKADAVLIIAPESEGVLFRLTLMAEQSACHVLGCSSESVKIASSKIQTTTFLKANNIDSIETNYLSNTTFPQNEASWVVKPDDAAGAENCYYCENNDHLYKLMNTINFENYILQKFQPGIPASLSMICNKGLAHLIACNLQNFYFENGKGVLKGIVVNGLLEYWQQLNVLAQKIARADKGLKGYVGVDLIMTDQSAVVVEINPRLTTSYVGLRKSLSLNPAELILSIWQNRTLPKIEEHSFIPVNLFLEDEHAV